MWSSLERAAPFPNRARILWLGQASERESDAGVSFPAVERWRQSASSIEDIALFTERGASLTRRGQPARRPGASRVAVPSSFRARWRRRRRDRHPSRGRSGDLSLDDLFVGSRARRRRGVIAARFHQIDTRPRALLLALWIVETAKDADS